jgi:hypothetical protein
MGRLLLSINSFYSSIFRKRSKSKQTLGVGFFVWARVAPTEIYSLK